MEFLKKSKQIEHEVNGKKIKFKGIPLKTIFKIRNLAEANKAISKLLAQFFTDKSKDAEVISSWLINPEVFEILQEANRWHCDWADEAWQAVMDKKKLRLPSSPPSTED